ncbi:MAG TPA: ABC transporter permease, partial [Candidatus Dormibacteraeota bacterium]|nr:ABC transporter permease [Candidatus Dormibacteraeota bacterium]
PGFLQPVAAVLPATALAELLRIALASGVAAGGADASATVPALILLAWAIAACGLAIRRFRWD